MMKAPMYEMVGPYVPAIPPTLPPPPEPPPHELREIIPPKQFCQVDRETFDVTGFFLQVTPPEDTETHFYAELNPVFSSATYPRTTPTQTLRYRNEWVVWEEDGPISELIEKAVAETYLDVDAIYEDAVGQRVTEYTEAEAEARAYLAADPKPDLVSDYIAGHAINNPTGQLQSPTWAAQQIVERADAFKWARLQMRNVRFLQQNEMRDASTVVELDFAIAKWEDFLRWLREILGLPTLSRG